MRTRISTKMLITLSICLFTFFSKAQDASVEKSVFGIQTSLFGIWAHNESKLTNQIALRSEIGLTSTIWAGNFYDKIGFFITPVILVEPRWYYNLNKRVSKSKRVDGNSGNFISLTTTYHPDWFVISNYDNLNIVNNVSIIPTWGIRRNIGKHFNYETGIGLGYRYIFDNQENKSDAVLNLHLRIGYRF